MNKLRKACLLLVVSFLSFQLCPAQTKRTDLAFSKWSFGAGAGWFGIPKKVMNRFVYEAPSLDGVTYGIRFGYERGSKSFASTSYFFSIAYERMRGSGIWQHKKESNAINGNIDFTQYSASVSVVLNFLDFLPINPYLGAGLGIGKIDAWVSGQLVSDIDIEEKDEIGWFVPVFCLPVGVRLKANDKFNVKIEAGFQNGFYAWGVLSLYF